MYRSRSSRPRRDRPTSGRGRPALGALAQHPHLARGQAEMQRPVQQRRRFVSTQPQVPDPHLQQFGVGPQPRQRQRRVAAPGHRHLHRPGQVVEEILHRLVHVGVGDHVIVIEDQHDGLRHRDERVDQQRQRQLGQVPARRPQRAVHLRAQLRRRGAQRRQHVAPEADWVIVQVDPATASRMALLRGRRQLATPSSSAPGGAETRINRALAPSVARRPGRCTGSSGSPDTQLGRHRNRLAGCRLPRCRAWQLLARPASALSQRKNPSRGSGIDLRSVHPGESG